MSHLEHPLAQKPLHILLIFLLIWLPSTKVFNGIFHLGAMGLTSSFVSVLFWSLLLRIGAAPEPCSSSIADQKPTVILKTIHIKTSILYNTTIPIDSDLTLTVENAPTHVDLITTYFSNPAISR